MDETAQLIEEQKKNLPPELVRVIEATAWEPVVQKIGQENNLTPEQLDALERETMLVLYAFEPPENLSTNIARELKISEEISKKISDSVWETIMEPINRRAGGGESAPSLIPEIAPEIHPVKVGFESNLNGAGPMVEKGEIAREATHTEEPAPIQQPAPKPEIERGAPEPIPTGTPIIGANFIPQGAAPAKTPEPPQVEPKPVTPPPPAPPQSPDVPSVEDRRYPGGVDPYREPLK